MRTAALLLTITLGACATAQPLPRFQLTEAHVKTVHDGLRASLKDPESARFGSMVAGVDEKGAVTVCGLVNAKNSFGGYVGNQPYIGMMDSRGLAFGVLMIGSDDTSRMTVAISCRGKGLDVARP